MYADWTKHLSRPEDKSEFEKDVRGSKRILDHLKGILLMKDHSLDVAERSVHQFDNPNWSHKQAYYNGYKAALTYLITLTDLDQQTKDLNDR